MMLCLVVALQALEERLRLVRAQRNKLLSAFENLQGSGMGHHTHYLACTTPPSSASFAFSLFFFSSLCLGLFKISLTLV